ncbi:MAG: hypothetical protein MH204_04080, partial [Fimbriimonadaceae bacterium]|nr:hypothetical protein [Fimbriimonadaceae bacterium]
MRQGCASSQSIWLHQVEGMEDLDKVAGLWNGSGVGVSYSAADLAMEDRRIGAAGGIARWLAEDTQGALGFVSLRWILDGEGVLGFLAFSFSPRATLETKQELFGKAMERSRELKCRKVSAWLVGTMSQEI